LVRDSGLEVILVNTESDEKIPPKPKAIAQTNLSGGGETTSERSTSPLINSPPHAQAKQITKCIKND
jgi:hypothetical protein